MNVRALIFGVLVSSSTVFAQGPVNEISAFQCSPRGATSKYIVWTEKTPSGQLITLGTLGTSGVEGIEKFTSARIENDDAVIYNSNDDALSLIINNTFDGEFYAGDLSLKKNGTTVTQEVACESHTPLFSDILVSPARARAHSIMHYPSYVWTCTAAPYNNYNYHWFYWEHVNVNFARSQALGHCNNFYAAPICGSYCR